MSIEQKIAGYTVSERVAAQAAERGAAPRNEAAKAPENAVPFDLGNHRAVVHRSSTATRISAKRIPRWLKGCVGCGLLAVLALQLDWSALADALHMVRWPLIGAAALLYPAALLLNAAKWSAALRLHDLSFRFGYLFRAGCAGFFVNNLLPSAIGGDIYRVYRTSAAGATSQAVSAVVLERIVGLSVMLLNGLFGALLLLESSALARAYVVWCLGALAAAASMATLYVLGRGKLLSALALAERLQPAIANLRRIARPHRAWGELIGYSVAFQLIAATLTYLALVAVGADLSFGGALLVSVAAGLAAIVPISISGIGVVEGSIVAAAVALGVQYDLAFLAALVPRALSLATSLACGIVYALEGERGSAQPAWTGGPRSALNWKVEIKER